MLMTMNHRGSLEAIQPSAVVSRIVRQAGSTGIASATKCDANPKLEAL
jgi:hypothetical protein